MAKSKGKDSLGEKLREFDEDFKRQIKEMNERALNVTPAPTRFDDRSGWYLCSFVTTGTAFPIALDSVIIVVYDKPTYAEISEVLMSAFAVGRRSEFAILSFERHPSEFFKGADLKIIKSNFNDKYHIK